MKTIGQNIATYRKDKKKTPLPLPVILDSQIQEDTLRMMRKDKKWVYNLLKKKNIKYENMEISMC